NTLLAAKNFKVKQAYTVIGNGAAELIKCLLESLKGIMGVVYPTFEEYPNRLDNSRLEVFTPDNPDFSYTADDIIEYFEDKPIDAFTLINPDNPSGNFISRQDLIKLCGWAQQKDIRLIIDESFVDFSEETVENSVICNEII